MLYRIIREKCSSCGLCADVCAVQAINEYGPYVIDPLICTGCGECFHNCPSWAIEKAEEE